MASTKPIPIVDPGAVEYNRRIILAATITVLVLSNASYVLRLVARRMQHQRLQADDYFMGLALPFSYIPAVCLLYGLTCGLGEHEVNVSKTDLRKFNISLFTLQRGNPPCLFCVKTSILILYARLFRTPTFKRVCIGVWVFTLCWAIAAFTSNILQCTPVSYFWNKAQPGHCIPNALITIGMTNGVLSFVGDLVILALPIPMIWKLQINTRRKMALNGIFLLGGFVCLTSIFRFVALARINVKDITYTQVAPGLWTYIELGIGITCGNLPLLRPLFGRFLAGTRSGTNNSGYGNSKSLNSYPLSRVTASVNGRGDTDGFQKMNGNSKYGIEVDVESVGEGSEVEFNTAAKIAMARAGNGMAHGPADTWDGEGIQVKTDVDLKIERVRKEIEIETARNYSRMAR
ncbi:hypothetical protein V8E51_017959 [Hyaloscypha variabilis]